MCGIVGFFGKPDSDYFKAFEDLLQIDVLRGPHSTGVAVLSKKRVDVVKGTCFPHVLMKSDLYNKAMSNGKKFGVIGHNRWATMGKITGENAHPFKVGKITGVHNGTVQSLFRYDNKYHRDTDSETLINVIDKEGVDHMWARMSGAASMVWWDAETKTINFLRNHDRPMWWVVLEKEEGIFFASEAWMLRGVLDRKNIKYVDNTTLYSSVDTLYTFKYDAVKQKIVQVAKRIVEKFNPVQRYDSQNVPFMFGHHQAQVRRGWHNFKDNSMTNGAATTKGGNNIVPYDMFNRPKSTQLEPPSDDGERLQGVTRADFDAYYDRCYFCNRQHVLDFETMVVLNSDHCEAICEECQDTAILNGVDSKHVHV